MRVPLERKVLNENDRIAAALRERFQHNRTFCLNLISSPGSGKTSLLERTLAHFGPSERVAVQVKPSRCPALFPVRRFPYLPAPCSEVLPRPGVRPVVLPNPEGWP